MSDFSSEIQQIKLPENFHSNALHFKLYSVHNVECTSTYTITVKLSASYTLQQGSSLRTMSNIDNFKMELLFYSYVTISCTDDFVFKTTLQKIHSTSEAYTV